MTWPLSRCGWCSEVPVRGIHTEEVTGSRTKIQMPTWVWLGGDGEDLPQSAQDCPVAMVGVSCWLRFVCRSGGPTAPATVQDDDPDPASLTVGSIVLCPRRVPVFPTPAIATRR
jgi:hypothetical protein